MSEQEHSWTPDTADIESWFVDGNHRFRFFVAPALFPIAQVLGAEGPKSSGLSRERVERSLSRKRDRAAERDPR